MHAASPSSPGPRVQELGDTLVVTFRPLRRQLGFLTFWLVAWTFFGAMAIGQIGAAGWGARMFLLFWLCGWAFGGGFAALQIAWQLAGREVLTVTPHQLEVRKRLGRFSTRPDAVHVLAVDDVRAERVPSGEDEKPRTDFRLRIVSSGETRLLVGEGMDERKADEVASVVRSHVHPWREWSAFERPVSSEPRRPPEPLEGVARKPGWIAPALVVAILLALSASVLLPGFRHPPPLPRLSPSPTVPVDLGPSPGGPPLREDFTDPRAYAVAMTRYSLESGQGTLESTPTCGGGVTWTHWICRARAISNNGPFAGRSLVYACAVADSRPRSPMLEILCGPEHPPPITP
jgi:hypothetical protein